MAFRLITRYAFLWSQVAKRFELHVWFAPNPHPNAQPEFRFTDLTTEEFLAVSTLLRDDPDRRIFCDTHLKQISSGVEPA